MSSQLTLAEAPILILDKSSSDVQVVNKHKPKHLFISLQNLAGKPEIKAVHNHSTSTASVLVSSSIRSMGLTGRRLFNERL